MLPNSIPINALPSFEFSNLTRCMQKLTSYKYIMEHTIDNGLCRRVFLDLLSLLCKFTI